MLLVASITVLKPPQKMIPATKKSATAPSDAPMMVILRQLRSRSLSMSVSRKCHDSSCLLSRCLAFVMMSGPLPSHSAACSRRQEWLEKRPERPLALRRVGSADVVLAVVDVELAGRRVQVLDPGLLFQGLVVEDHDGAVVLVAAAAGPDGDPHLGTGLVVLHVHRHGVMLGGAVGDVDRGQLAGLLVHDHDRSEERRVGKECRSRWAP